MFRAENRSEPMDRRKARAHAMKLLYEWEMGGDGGEDTFFNLLEIKADENETDYMNAMVEGVKANVAEIDARIDEYSNNWKTVHMPKVDLSILRLGVYELMCASAPPAVVVNEAVVLANTYSTDKSGRFINGILGNIARKDERA